MRKESKSDLTDQIFQWQCAFDRYMQHYESFEDKDSAEAMEVYGKASALQKSINEAKISISKIETEEAKQERKTKWNKLKPELKKTIEKYHIGYIIPENKFIYCDDVGVKRRNVEFSMFPATAIVRMMSSFLSPLGHFDYQEMIDYFEELGKTYRKVTSSFDSDKWDGAKVYNKMPIVKNYWLKPNYKATSYNDFFDILFDSIAGGKEENKRHLEQWVTYKYLFPNKNSNTPNIDIGGIPGGNGKGNFIQLLKTIFTPICVIQAHKEELEKFNANWEMATVLYYDEPEEKELSPSKLKQTTGSDVMRIEKKGIDATMADRNYNFLFLSNNSQGVVKLSGGSNGGEDRRYSVIFTNCVLKDKLKAFFSGQEDQEQAALLALDYIAQVLVKDEQMVADWLGCMINKYKFDHDSTLSALHGVDYKARFETQKDSVTLAFDRLLPILQKQGILPAQDMCVVTKQITGIDRLSEIKLNRLFSEYLQKASIAHVTLDRYKLTYLFAGKKIARGSDKCKVFVLDAETPPMQFESNELYKTSTSIGTGGVEGLVI